MAYKLFFLNNRTLLGLRITHSAWNSTNLNCSDITEGIVNYLGGTSEWHTTKGARGSFGFNGCARVRKTTTHVEVGMVLRQKTVRQAMLTLSFLLQALQIAAYKQKSPKQHLILSIGCGADQSVYGKVSAKFKQSLASIGAVDQDNVMDDMQRGVRSQNLFSKST